MNGMSFRIEFDTDNAAFEDALYEETKRILEDISDQIYYGHREGTIRDSNGNRIGSWEAD